MAGLDDAVIAKLKSHGFTFEILVDCESALAYKEGKETDLDKVILAQEVFEDVKKGNRASHAVLAQVFGSVDFKEIVDKIIRKGDIQLTAEYQAKLRENKRKKIINLIHVNCIDVKTGRPHPPLRIELAFEECKIRIDDVKSAEAQVQDIVKKLQRVLPIKFEIRIIEIKVAAKYTSTAYNRIKGFGRVLKENWNSDGSLSATLEIPAGLQEEFEITLNSLAHGQIELNVVERK
ncbi:MAG TPA: ribosome assembly factor SBDS [Candidatus Nanoarchaeia archaeon]|nr:ribosome assembly factor SBDS [Candidatus Nanoarchaeia archaeon]